jgi:hypothetical protein
MARDYEDLNDTEHLDDRELRDLVREHLEAHNAIDADEITVHVENGAVALSGRVGTEAERRIADHILTDTLGLNDFRNDIVVDPIRRPQSPEEMDEHLAAEDAATGLLLGDRPVPLSPEAEHLEPAPDAELGGTTDVQSAIERAASWIPPEGPTPEGLPGTDAQPEDYGEQH